VAVGLVNATRTLARSGPLLIGVDDLQWLDAPSTRALTFALRRFRSEPIGALVAGRELSPMRGVLERSAGASAIHGLEVGPISLSALYQLLRSRLGVALSRPELLRVAEASGYNPLFALEIARSSIDGSTTTRSRPLPVPQKLQDLLEQRLERLDGETTAVLLAAAAMSSPTVIDVAPAAALAEADAGDVLDRAAREGIVRIDDGSIRFVHPLLASAVYDRAGPAEQRRVHARLATVAAHPEERARHLALSAPRPNTAVADALDEAATHARERGATDAAARFAEQSLSFTPPDDRRSRYRRALAAGTLASAAGEHVRSRALFERALEAAEPGPGRAEAALALAGVADLLPRRVELCDQALEEADPEPGLVSRIHRTRGAIAYFMGDVQEAERRAALAVDAAERARDPLALGTALAELAHWTFCGGGGVRRGLFDRAISLEPSAGAASPRTHLATVLLDSGDLDAAREHLVTLVAETMRDGDLAGAAIHHFHLAELALWSGDWPAAIEHADESLLLRQHADQPSAPLYVRAMAHACLGRVEEARRDAGEGLADAERTDDVVFVMQNLHVLGFVELSVGDHAEAHRYLGRATDLLRPRWFHEFGDCRIVPDEIESLVSLGEFDRAEGLVGWMREVGRRTERPWTIATGERSHALLRASRGDLDGAAIAIDHALAAHERLAMPFELARTLLLHGDLQRRRKRRGEGRVALERSLATFEELGAPLWAGKARESLARLGIRTEAQTELTPIEDRIALLAVEGRTNREIAATLFVSPKTVEANLSRIYRKLGIRSRTALASAIRGRGPSPDHESDRVTT
jgi:DNA-binding CsgD family transcriptional regulator